MVPKKKFRGVRQRHWGSWVADLRHPLLKRRVWLGTFETAEEAARAYDEAAVLISGRNAKTNFPFMGSEENGGENSPPPPSPSFSSILNEKLRKCCKSPSASVTCLRLDTESSHIGVWQKRAGSESDSNWVMTIELGKKNNDRRGGAAAEETETAAIGEERGGTNEEEKIALEMIEELMN
ncbi:hypothetical protein ACS0TY_012577 [Phlomoides rotata]